MPVPELTRDNTGRLLAKLRSGKDKFANWSGGDEGAMRENSNKGMVNGKVLQPRRWDSLLAGLDWPRIATHLRLSDREAQVTRLVLEGMTISAIAEEMDLAVGTVKTYNSRVHAKLGVTDQRELTLAVLDVALH